MFLPHLADLKWFVFGAYMQAGEGGAWSPTKPVNLILIDSLRRVYARSPTNLGDLKDTEEKCWVKGLLGEGPPTLVDPGMDGLSLLGSLLGNLG